MKVRHTTRSVVKVGLQNILSSFQKVPRAIGEEDQAVQDGYHEGLLAVVAAALVVEERVVEWEQG